MQEEEDEDMIVPYLKAQKKLEMDYQQTHGMKSQTEGEISKKACLENTIMKKYSSLNDSLKGSINKAEQDRFGSPNSLWKLNYSVFSWQGSVNSKKGFKKALKLYQKHSHLGLRFMFYHVPYNTCYFEKIPVPANMVRLVKITGLSMTCILSLKCMKKILQICAKASDLLGFYEAQFFKPEMGKILQVSKAVKSLRFRDCQFYFDDSTNFNQELRGSRIFEIGIEGKVSQIISAFSFLLSALSKSEDVARSLRYVTVGIDDIEHVVRGFPFKKLLESGLKGLGLEKVEVRFENY